MATKNKNLSEHTDRNLTDVSGQRFAIVVAEWNEEITGALAEGARQTLLRHGVAAGHILQRTVPGAFELSLGAQWMAQRADVSAVICLGCVIKGETAHNEYINHAVAHGLTQVGLRYNKPVIFGVLTPNTIAQARDRAGGQYGNKGDEAAVTALKMLGFEAS